jgi:hypothetical protein
MITMAYFGGKRRPTGIAYSIDILEQEWGMVRSLDNNRKQQI